MSFKKEFTNAINDFAFDLMRSCSVEDNVFISPFSISTALAMIYLGSDGTTSERLREVLNYDKYGLSDTEIHQQFQTALDTFTRAEDGYDLSMFNAVMIQKNFGVLESYRRSLTCQYLAELETVDFETEGEKSRFKINSAVEKATRGKITEFLTKTPERDCKLFLINAVYFLGNWKDQFDEGNTYEGSFYNKGVQQTTVKMMSRDGYYRYGWIENLEASAVVLPYDGDRSASMIIVLPDSKTGIRELERRITRNVLETNILGLPRRKIHLSIPKFRLEFQLDLIKPLTDLGLSELFSDDADLSRMAGIQKELRVTSAVHKAVVEVHEKGCEAAAATGFECGVTCLPPEVTVQHPFLFFIIEDSSGKIMFFGRVDEL